MKLSTLVYSFALIPFSAALTAATITFPWFRWIGLAAVGLYGLGAGLYLLGHWLEEWDTVLAITLILFMGALLGVKLCLL